MSKFVIFPIPDREINNQLMLVIKNNLLYLTIIVNFSTYLITTVLHLLFQRFERVKVHEVKIQVCIMSDEMVLTIKAQGHTISQSIAYPMLVQHLTDVMKLMSIFVFQPYF